MSELTKRRKRKLQRMFKAPFRKDFYEEFISLRETGATPIGALREMYTSESREGLTPNAPMAQILKDMMNALSAGEDFSEAVAPWVPNDDLMMLRATINSPDFCTQFATYLELLEVKDKIRKTIKDGIKEAGIKIIMLTLLILMFGFVMIPKIEPMFPMENWTGLALVLKGLYYFAIYGLPVVGASIFVASVIIRFALPRWTGSLRKKADKLPIFALYREITGLNFVLSLASLLQAGMSGVRPINMLRPAATPYVRMHLNAIRAEVKNGRVLGSALYEAQTNWPSDDVNLKIKTFSASNDISKHMTIRAKKWAKETVESIEGTMNTVTFIAMALTASVILIVFMGTVGLVTSAGQAPM